MFLVSLTSSSLLRLGLAVLNGKSLPTIHRLFAGDSLGLENTFVFVTYVLVSERIVQEMSNRPLPPEHRDGLKRILLLDTRYSITISFD